jgi:hypothetical protein
MQTLHITITRQTCVLLKGQKIFKLKSWEGRAADLQTQDAGASRHKVPCVIICVEPNEVCLQHSFQDLHPDWKRAVNLRGGEGSVQEEADLMQHMLLVPGGLTRTRARTRTSCTLMAAPECLALVRLLRTIPTKLNAASTCTLLVHARTVGSPTFSDRSMS